jgi:Protein of unknown function (DUF664)
MTTTNATTREHQAHRASLEATQQRVLGLLDGLDDTQLRASSLPSGWTPLGLLHHLTAMTQFWFRDVLCDDHQALPSEDGPNFGLDPASSTEEVRGAYVRETTHAIAALGRLDLDAEPAYWPEGIFGPWRLHTQREVLLHVLVELSTHAGHLDVARELADGRTWSYELGRVATPDERVGRM